MTGSVRPRLVSEPNAVFVLSVQVADRIGIPQEHIEKDFWVTEILRGVASESESQGVPVFFKGGTSLSKAHHLIQRFSEDVDILALLPDDKGKTARNTILKSLVAAASHATAIAPAEVPGNKEGLKRSARFHYRAGSTSGALSEGVLLELGARGGAMPSTSFEICSLLAEHAPTEMAEFAESEPFMISVLDASRTLVEKLVLLHTAFIGGDETVIGKAARHYYDIHQLLNDPATIKAMREPGIVVLARDVCTYSHAAGLPAEPRPANGFAESPAFKTGNLLRIAEDGYNRSVIDQLAWDPTTTPSFSKCVDAVISYAEIL